MPCRQKLPIHERKAHYEFIGLVSMLTDLASLAPNEIGLPPKAAAAVAPSKNVSALVHHSRMASRFLARAKAASVALPL
jgi:hypothetical protein